MYVSGVDEVIAGISVAIENLRKRIDNIDDEEVRENIIAMEMQLDMIDSIYYLDRPNY